MKYELSSSNFKVYHETYLNPFHPYYNGGARMFVNQRWVTYHDSFPTSGLNIFDYAMIVDKTTGQTIKENEKLTPGKTFGLSSTFY